MKGSSEIKSAEVIELNGGMIGKTAALALSRLILDYARQNPDETGARNENTEEADE